MEIDKINILFEEKNISPPPEIRIGVGGNVDAGKSSFVGVITKNILDNGRGYARSFILKHKHEQETGRTSAVSQQYIKMTDKVIEFNDLAGHEKYYKCTAKELSNNFLDYVALIVNSGSGVQLMTREHMALAYSLRIPMFVIYTKIDSSPKNIYDMNLEYLKSYYLNKMNLEAVVISNETELNTFYQKNEKNNNNDNNIDLPTNTFSKGSKFVPVFPVSNVSGVGIDLVRKFLNGLEKYNNYKELENKEVNFLICRTYHVQGIGLVVSGIMKSGTIKKGDILYLGPNANGFQRDGNSNTIISTPNDYGTSNYTPINNFYKIAVKGIHNNFQENIDYLKAGYSGCFNIKPVGRTILKRNMIRQGMRILSDVKSVYQFDAKIKIYNSSSTITKKYQPVLHCGGISQAVQIVKMDKEYLRSFDEAIVTFKFIYRPEYLETGNIFIMREGNLKALGKVLKID
jgi:GTPase